MDDVEGRRLLMACESNQTVVAREVGVDPSAVSGWFRRHSRPSPKNRKRIRLRFGIPEEAWLTEDERAEQARFEQAAHTKKVQGEAA